MPRQPHGVFSFARDLNVEYPAGEVLTTSEIRIIICNFRLSSRPKLLHVDKRSFFGFVQAQLGRILVRREQPRGAVRIIAQQLFVFV